MDVDSRLKLDAVGWRVVRSRSAAFALVIWPCRTRLPDDLRVGCVTMSASRLVEAMTPSPPPRSLIIRYHAVVRFEFLKRWTGLGIARFVRRRTNFDRWLAQHISEAGPMRATEQTIENCGSRGVACSF